MTTAGTRPTRPFGIRDKVGYGLGDFADSLFFVLASTYLIVFYTDVFGLNAAFGGTLLLIAKGWEGVVDVVWGRFIDTRRPSRGGKFRPWLLRMSIPLLITGVLMFVPIPGSGDTFVSVISTSLAPDPRAIAEATTERAGAGAQILVAGSDRQLLAGTLHAIRSALTPVVPMRRTSSTQAGRL